MKYPELLADNRSTLEKSVAQLVVVRIDEESTSYEILSL